MMRGKGGSLIVVISAIALFHVLSASYAGPPVEKSRCNVPFHFVMAQQQSGITQGKDFVIRNEGEWCRFWEDVYSYMYPSPECNTALVDFTREVAIVSALGERPNTCYANAITCIESGNSTTVKRDARGAITIYVEEIIPGSNCHCLFSIVKPVYVVKVRKPVTSVTFVHYETILECE